MAMEDLNQTELRGVIAMLALGTDLGPALAELPIPVRVEAVNLLHRAQPLPEDLYAKLISNPGKVVLSVHAVPEDAPRGWSESEVPLDQEVPNAMSAEETQRKLRERYFEAYNGVPMGQENSLRPSSPEDSLMAEAEAIVANAAQAAQPQMPQPVSSDPERKLTEQEQKLLAFGAVAATGVNPFEAMVGGTGGTPKERLEKVFLIALAAEEMGIDIGPYLGKMGLDWPPGSKNYHGSQPPETNGGHAPGCPHGQ